MHRFIFLEEFLASNPCLVRYSNLLFVISAETHKHVVTVEQWSRSLTLTYY